MLSMIFGFLSGPLSAIIKEIAETKRASLNAQTERERLENQEKLKALEARRDVLIAESRVSPINAHMRAYGLALPVSIVLWKIFVWDKALGQWTGGHTDALDPKLWEVIMIVLGFYFLYETAATVSRIWKRG